nr:hypothetical protein [uncultured Draconibacterium sp.]
MKQMKQAILALLILALVPTVVVHAQNDRKYQKELSKVYKKKTKELKKDGWKVSGSSLTLDAAVMKHLRTLNANEQKREIIGEVSNCGSLNLGKQHAFDNAAITYANSAGSYIRGRIASELSNDATSADPNGIDHFYAAYERKVETEIRGCIKASFSLAKKKDKNYAYQTWFIVDEEEASQARMRAVKLAVAESKLKQEHAELLSKFVQEGFNVSN